MKQLALFLVAILGVILPQSALTQSALRDIVQLEVLEGGMSSDGTYQAALRLNMADGWKTYWRTPGDAGIPPRLTLTGSRNIAETSITWPTPLVFDQGGMRSIGYSTQLVLPITLTPKSNDRRVKFKGRIEFGICHDVCIPASLDFSRDLAKEAPRNPAIAAALAARPFSASEAGVGTVTCTIAPTEDGLKITASISLPSTGAAEFAVFETDNPAIWSSEAKVSRRGNVLTATSELIHVDGAPYVLDRSALRITVIGSKHAVDIRGCSAN